jgi:glycosyltransferase involved in cell wall biosynthesis
MNRFKSKEDKLISSTIVSNNEYLRYLQNSKSIPFFPNNQFRGKARVMNLINRMNTERLLKRGDYDVFHPTFYDSYFFKFLGNKPFVVTVHDLINEKFINQFEYLKLEEKITNDKHLLMKEAYKIIAVSESTKKDIIDHYQIDKNKIEVIYHGNSLLKKSVSEDAKLSFQYVLFVGKRSMYKNFLFTLKSIHHLLKQYKIKFVCYGGGEFSFEEIELIKKLELQKFVIQINKNDDQSLQNLYSNALFFIFPSMYEGFGIPLLEAFGCECPVLTSDGGALREIGVDAVTYFDPYDSQSLSESFYSMLNSSDLRKQCVKRGIDRLSFFSWDKTFSQHIDVYKSIL